jgi:hypothetical protein
MNRFIEVHIESSGLALSVSVRSIVYFAPEEDALCEISFDPDWSITVSESYDEVKKLIEEAK